MMNTHKKGFTLIELVVVLGVMAILVTLALPSFQDALRKSRRSDAMNTVMDIHLAQERYRANNIAYGENADLGFDAPQLSPKGHYSVETVLPLAGDPATTYTITATPSVGSDQENDYCGSFVLSNTAGVIARTSSTGVADLCWRK
jgi:type IV pilus assembly protein PilE